MKSPRQIAIEFAAEYAYSLVNTKENPVKTFKSPPSIVYEQFERAYDRWIKRLER